MDVTSTIKRPTNALDVLSQMSAKKVAADASWNGTLNHAAAQRPIDPLQGVSREQTLQNAKVSALPDEWRSKFASALDKASDARQSLAPDKLAKLEKTSETLVNQFFMGSMMKQMRNSPFKNDMFTGGKGGDAYAGLFDQQISEHTGNRIAKNLVKSMVKQYAKNADAVNDVVGSEGAK